jgi:hypothetical protein
MDRASFYVRVKPDYLRAVEKYYYSSEISRNPESRQSKDPEGSISYMVPFDGETFFSRTSLQDFQRQQREKSLTGTTGRIGHFVLDYYLRTDMETRYDLVGNYSSIGIDIPLRNESLAQDKDLVADRFQAIGNYDYVPNPPELNPVSIRVLVFDEDSFKEKLDLTELPNDSGDGNTLTDKVAKELMIQQGFKALIFLFEISLALPTYAGDLINRTSNDPLLQFISLEWPFPTSQTNVSLGILGSEARKKLIYDPHQARIEWGGVKFNKGERREGVDAFSYTLPIAKLGSVDI